MAYKSDSTIFLRAISKALTSGPEDAVSNRDLMAGFVRLHVLHHANSGPIFGIGIIERLAFHGYMLSPGTLYPILHGLERDGFLGSRGEVVGKRRRRIYEITVSGRSVLILSRIRLWGLCKEVFENELSPDTSGQVEEALRIAMVKVGKPSAPPRRTKKRLTHSRRRRSNKK